MHITARKTRLQGSMLVEEEDVNERVGEKDRERERVSLQGRTFVEEEDIAEREGEGERGKEREREGKRERV